MVLGDPFTRSVEWRCVGASIRVNEPGAVLIVLWCCADSAVPLVLC